MIELLLTGAVQVSHFLKVRGLTSRKYERTFSILSRKPVWACLATQLRKNWLSPVLLRGWPERIELSTQVPQTRVLPLNYGHHYYCAYARLLVLTPQNTTNDEHYVRYLYHKTFVLPTRIAVRPRRCQRDDLRCGQARTKCLKVC